jgi:hypothetical protein
MGHEPADLGSHRAYMYSMIATNQCQSSIIQTLILSHGINKTVCSYDLSSLPQTLPPLLSPSPASSPSLSPFASLLLLLSDLVNYKVA